MVDVSIASRSCPDLVGGQHRRLAFFHGILEAAHGAGRVHRQDLARHQPVEQHANGGELQIDGGRCDSLLEFLDVGTDMRSSRKCGNLTWGRWSAE